MGIVNRDKDASEKQYSKSAQFHSVVATALDVPLTHVSHPSKLKSALLSCFSISGTPVYQIEAHRWTADGETQIALGPAVTVAVAFGVSGTGVTFASSLAALQTGDVLVLKSTGTNTASLRMAVDMVLEATQDIKEEFGSQS